VPAHRGQVDARPPTQHNQRMATAPSQQESAELRALLDELVEAHRQLVAAIRAGHDAEIDLAEERANEIVRRIKATRVA
jgi:hypothetical protein